jgi:hypothetical protein
MARLVILLLTRRWGLIIVGLLLVIGGVIWGLSSHQVAYQTSTQGTNYHLAVGTQSGNLYINADGSSDYFAAFKNDFNPPIPQSDIDNSDTITFVARTDTSSLDPALNTDTGTVNDAHKIEKIVFYKGNSVLATFTTAEYNANPNGFYDNEWLKSIWLVLVGLLMGGAALLVPMFAKKPQPNAGFNIAAAGAQPYQQPNPGPYGQPYQGPQSYQQPGQYTPPPPAYGQPPYQQPGQYPPQPPVYGQPPYQGPQQ